VSIVPALLGVQPESTTEDHLSVHLKSSDLQHSQIGLSPLLIAILSGSNSENDTKTMDETLAQVVADVTPSGLVPLHVSTQKKITVKGMAIDVQREADTLRELEEVSKGVRREIQGLCTTNQLFDLQNTLEMQLELRAKKVHVAIEKSNLKLLEAVSARLLSFLKGFGDKEQAETNKDKSEYFYFSSDPLAKLDPGTKLGRSITQDW
jgi:hypothetical protein